MNKTELYDKLHELIIGDLEPYGTNEAGDVTCNEEYEKKEELLGRMFFAICCRKPEMIRTEECTRVLTELVAP